MDKTISAIAPGISRNQARGILCRVAGTYKPQVQKLVYYPYLWTHYEYTVKTILGKRSVRAYILVDLIHNIASTSDSFDYEDISVDEEIIIPRKIDVETAGETAKTYLLHSAVHKMKTLLLPEARIRERREIYKPFWIVKCVNRNRESFRVLVDGLTGKYEILSI